MVVYNLLMESFYYDGDDYVLVDVHTFVKSFSAFDKAKDAMERSIQEELFNGTESKLTRDGDDYAVFQSQVEDGVRIDYRLTIYETEVM